MIRGLGLAAGEVEGQTLADVGGWTRSGERVAGNDLVVTLEVRVVYNDRRGVPAACLAGE